MTNHTEKGWLQRDFDAAKREIKTWPRSIRKYLKGASND
jgi:hypothetical protein